MADFKPAGWVVRVTTQSISGGTPMTALYAAALPMPSDAEKVVRQRDRATADEKVEAVDPLNQSALDGLGLEHGCVQQYPDR